jgi:23S rRNA (adenine2030-N6)-methyltransferase
MLSYQHAYHAGNAADLHKHAVLAELLVRLTAKPRGLAYLETHAGRGLYDLAAPEALKTGEAEHGIGRIAPDPEGPYGRSLAAVRARHGATAYPGSPLIARHLLRPQDRMVLMELHPAEHAALCRALGPSGTGGPAVAVHRRDGWEGILALTPPRPRRGLVLVDPSWEIKADYERAVTVLRRLVARWPEAVILVWYPLLAAGRHERLVAGLESLPHLRDEVGIVGRQDGMTGLGLILLNAPHGAGTALAAAHHLAAGVIEPLTPARRRRAARPRRG